MPRLTTINIGAREIGVETGKLILDILDGKDEGTHVTISPKLIVRKTTK